MSEQTKPVATTSEHLAGTIRERERAIWTDVERVGRELRATEAAKPMTQAGMDKTKLAPRQ